MPTKEEYAFASYSDVLGFDADPVPCDSGVCRAAARTGSHGNGFRRRRMSCTARRRDYCLRPTARVGPLSHSQTIPRKAARRQRAECVLGVKGPVAGRRTTLYNAGQLHRRRGGGAKRLHASNASAVVSGTQGDAAGQCVSLIKVPLFSSALSDRFSRIWPKCVCHDLLFQRKLESG